MITETRHRHEDIGAAECWELLGIKHTGRLAFADTSRIQVFPVNYVVHEGAIYFRTSAYGAIGSQMRNVAVSFQIDEFDDFLQSGWSVLLSGHARAVENTDLLAELWGRPQRPEPWAGGIRSLFIRIRPEVITGRRVHPG